MMLDQTDLGFDFAGRVWFMKYFSATRFETGLNFIDANNIKFKNVPFDTYAFGDQQSPIMSHGRLRCYSNVKVKVEGNPSIFDSATITGSDEKLVFQKLVGKQIEIRYDTKSMGWFLNIDGTDFYTKNITGIITSEKLTGAAVNEKVRIYLNNMTILYSLIVTLVNTNLDIKA